MKKILFFALILFFGIYVNVNASEVYYSNSIGVNFTEEQYNFVSNFYWNGYQDDMDCNDYNYLFNDGIGTNIEHSKLIPFQLFGTSYSTPSKSLKITKAQVSDYYLISVTANWLVSPKVRSYDVIGAYMSSSSLVENPITKVRSTAGISNYNNLVKDNNGFGVSVKLPTSGNDISIIQTYKVSGNGTIYASYQHATKSISLDNSKKYSLSLSGYGNVFDFSNSVKDSYDQMRGVNIAI